MATYMNYAAQVIIETKAKAMTAHSKWPNSNLTSTILSLMAPSWRHSTGDFGKNVSKQIIFFLNLI